MKGVMFFFSLGSWSFYTKNVLCIYFIYLFFLEIQGNRVISFFCCKKVTFRSTTLANDEYLFGILAVLFDLTNPTLGSPPIQQSPPG